MTVGGSNHCPTHYGVVQISVKNDEGDTIVMQLPEALYFPSSPVNVLSIGRLIKYFGNGNIDAETCIKSTGDISWFSWDRGHHQRTIPNPPSGFQELVINKFIVQKKIPFFLQKCIEFLL